MSKYNPDDHIHFDKDHPPTVEQLASIKRYFYRMAGEAEAPGWMRLYLDMADIAADVEAAWRGEIQP